MKNSKKLEVLAKINSKRKYRAVDLIEYVLYNHNIIDNVENEKLLEWVPADTRMGFIKGNNLDVYGALLGIVLGFIVASIVASLWIAFKFIVILSSVASKLKKD
ncbi:hypothetical protein C1645_877519 [Glomus cerebriforme]|uniref:Uncharacterized protein n=1 Tax=Glomus cerebriforme TaxID=658196 RepID=A0A397SQI5_9GLOM|nr:hypothetical protein C1645_877519 [Glomus cerebriforme]